MNALQYGDFFSIHRVCIGCTYVRSLLNFLPPPPHPTLLGCHRALALGSLHGREGTIIHGLPLSILHMIVW